MRPTPWRSKMGVDGGNRGSALETEVDVVVLGSGAAGLAAAVVAAKSGAKVLLLEKADVFGGSTAISGGVVWIPCNALMSGVGISDSKEQARAYLGKVLGNKIRWDLVDAFLDNGPDMVDFMHAHTELRLIPREHAPDYYPDIEGASTGGRSLDPQIYDGRKLGKWFAKLKRPIPQFMVFGGMMVGRKEIDQLLGTFDSPKNFLATARLLALYARERVSYGRGARLLQGNSLAAQLLKSAIDAGVELWSDCRIDQIELVEGRAGRVTLNRQGQAQSVRARSGIVLAGGGAAADAAGMRAHLSWPDHHFSMAPQTNTGELQKLAVALGASIDDAVVDPVNYAPVSVFREGSREIRFPHLFLDRAKPGLIAVNARGRRFVDEATSYHNFVRAMIAQPDGAAVPAWLVCDAAFLRQYGMGLVRPGIGSRKRYLAAGYLRKGATIAELARSIGVPEEALTEEISRHNRFAAAGHDPDHGKGGNAYDLHQGDPRHSPNPCLGPINRAPFYAVAVYPGDIGSTRGLITDDQGRVLDRERRPIRGLYACGNEMNSPMAGTYPGAGITLGPALTFGYIVGRSLGLQTRSRETPKE
ncbi:FAD binding domain-containing protein [Chelatococcus asaccharovorans]|uniref:FAD binding domain-containing protein n=1 Tax=Chelatococcus asaccharovorans TaxID=28210 RepID=A0A2V3TTL1_9HYPH|nr:FAD binding domain-containing protein [Chelatococcus asaccharovorans]